MSLSGKRVSNSGKPEFAFYVTPVWLYSQTPLGGSREFENGVIVLNS